MNKIFGFLVAFLFALSVTAQSNAIDKYFSQYESNPDFSVVYVSPKMFKMVAKVTDEKKDAELTELIKGISGLKILNTDKNGLKYYNEALKKIPVKEYDVLLTVKDKGENIKFYTKGNEDVVEELLLVVGGNDQFTLLNFTGKLDLRKIAKLANKLDIEGSQYLDKINKK
jgi:vacuolar-type H+-ATPase subunit F/Vma7